MTSTPPLTPRKRHAESVEKLHVKILSTIATLTPPNCMECSTQEVCANLTEDGITLSVRGLASHLGNLREHGLVQSRVYMQRHLWKLTAEGRRWLKQHQK